MDVIRTIFLRDLWVSAFSGACLRNLAVLGGLPAEKTSVVPKEACPVRTGDPRQTGSNPDPFGRPSRVSVEVQAANG